MLQNVGKLSLDRVIDVPVYQDVLTWDGSELGFLKGWLCHLF
jgi:hypothetical protein